MTAHRFRVLDMFGGQVELTVEPEEGATGYVTFRLSNGEGFAMLANDEDRTATRFAEAVEECAAEACQPASPARVPAAWRGVRA